MLYNLAKRLVMVDVTLSVVASRVQRCCCDCPVGSAERDSVFTFFEVDYGLWLR